MKEGLRFYNNSPRDKSDGTSVGTVVGTDGSVGIVTNNNTSYSNTTRFQGTVIETKFVMPQQFMKVLRNL